MRKTSPSNIVKKNIIYFVVSDLVNELYRL